MAPPLIIKRSKKSAAKGAGEQGAPARPVKVIVATVVVTAALILAASYLLPYLPKPPSGPAGSASSSPPAPAPSVVPPPTPVEREPSVPLPPIGQTPSRLLPPPAVAPGGAVSGMPVESPAAPSAGSPGESRGTVQQALQEAATMAAPAPSTQGAQASPPAPTAATPGTPGTQGAAQPRSASKPAPAPAKSATTKGTNQPVIQNDPPVTPVERAHKNTLLLAKVEKTSKGSCTLRLVSAEPMGRIKWLVLDAPSRVAVDLIGSWDVNAMTSDRGDGLCARELRLGRHPDRIRVVVELAGGSTFGPRSPVVDKPSPKELLVTLPHR